MKQHSLRYLTFSAVTFVLLTLYDTIKAQYPEFLNYYIAIAIGAIGTYALMLLENE